MTSARAFDGGDGPTARPALQKAVADMQQLSNEWMAGFESKQAVLQWAQRAVIRFIGEIPAEFWHQIADVLLPGSDGRHRLLHDALLDDLSDWDLPAEYARAYRDHVRREVLVPAASRAISWLSDQATTMPDEADTDPADQEYPALQIELASIDTYQSRGVEAALTSGLDADQLHGWAVVCQLGANGNRILPTTLRESIETGNSFAQCIEREPVIQRALTATDPDDRDRRLRELVVSRFLLPAWTRGVRDVRINGSEVPTHQSDGLDFGAA